MFRKGIARVWIFVSQGHYDGFIANPSIAAPQLPKPKKKPGRPKLPSNKKGRSAEYDEASKLATSASMETLMKATGIKARREELSNSAHVFRAMQKGPEKTASHYRKASVAYKKRCKYISTANDLKNRTKMSHLCYKV